MICKSCESCETAGIFLTPFRIRATFPRCSGRTESHADHTRYITSALTYSYVLAQQVTENDECFWVESSSRLNVLFLFNGITFIILEFLQIIKAWIRLRPGHFLHGFIPKPRRTGPVTVHRWSAFVVSGWWRRIVKPCCAIKKHLTSAKAEETA